MIVNSFLTHLGWSNEVDLGR